MSAQRGLLPLLLLSIASCGVLLQIIEPATQPPIAGAERYSPSARYATFWKTLEGCAGRKGSFASIRWFKASSIVVDGTEYAAYWFGKWNRVVIRDDRIADVQTIKHEMMHALLQRGDHPAAYFNGSCGRLMENE